MSVGITDAAQVMTSQIRPEGRTGHMNKPFLIKGGEGSLGKKGETETKGVEMRRNRPPWTNYSMWLDIGNSTFIRALRRRKC